MIEVRSLEFGYGRQAPVFEGFDWQVSAGESWAIIGPSGCGKTTLLYLLAGLRMATGGSIRINGELVDRPRPATGMILQDHGMLPWATVEANARLGLDIRRFYGPDGRHAPADWVANRDQVVKGVAYWLEHLGIASLAGKYPSQISGGQRQRAAIARTLVLQPDLLLLDEPFSALDAPTREDLQNLVVRLRQETRLTTVIVTHNIEEAVFLGKRILVLDHPPNREPRIIENPGAETSRYRESAEFASQAGQIRALLGMNHETTPEPR